jgi:hypothetical protein
VVPADAAATHESDTHRASAVDDAVHG